MSRYEFAKGSSNKFWEITLSKKSFTTTYGKVGTKGQTTNKQFASATEAKKAHDKLVVAKTKKGYVLQGKTSKTVPNKAGKSNDSAGSPGARYFELVDAKSSKFWEVMVKATSLTTRYGKIGAKGQSKCKEFGSAAEAKKARDKLVTEKSKKGYVEQGTTAKVAAATTKTAAFNPKLEAAIVTDPDDLEVYAVLADWLQEQDDPRGELMSLQLNNKHKQAATFIKKHSDYFLGPLVEHQKVYDEGFNNGSSSLRTSKQEKIWQKTHMEAFLWHIGYIGRVRLSHDQHSNAGFDGKLVDVLSAVLAHPSGRLISEFAFQSNDDPNEDDLQDLIDLLAKKAPRTTRKLTFGDNVDQISWHHTGNLKKLWKGVPNLQMLEIETGHFDVGKMVAPALRRAIFITGGLSKTCGRNIAKAEMPNIEHLEIYYGDDMYGGLCTVKEVRPLLDRTDLKRLQYLGLKNSMFADDIAKALRGAKVLKKLKTLDLSLGTMTDEGAKALVAAKTSLKHLECLDLTRNYLSKDGIKAVKGLCKQVITSNQQEPEDYGSGELEYFVSVAE